MRYICNKINDLGKIIFVFGLLICVVGLALWSGFGRSWIGRLPGDIHYTRGHFSFHFPIVTCLLVSLVLTALAWLLRR
jgi:hypothetical protein